jgi:hypothetical protein
MEKKRQVKKPQDQKQYIISICYLAEIYECKNNILIKYLNFSINYFQAINSSANHKNPLKIRLGGKMKEGFNFKFIGILNKSEENNIFVNLRKLNCLLKGQ